MTSSRAVASPATSTDSQKLSSSVLADGALVNIWRYHFVVNPRNSPSAPVNCIEIPLGMKPYATTSTIGT